MSSGHGTPLDPDHAGDHIDRLYRAAWALCGSREDPSLVQETYARACSRNHASCATKTTSATSCARCGTRSSFASAPNGADGDDVLIGGAGDDLLFGGPGLDSLDGGPGNNVVIQG